MSDQTPSTDSAATPGSRLPLYATVAAVVVTAATGVGAILWNAKFTDSPAALTASVSAPDTPAREGAAAAAAAVAEDTVQAIGNEAPESGRAGATVFSPAAAQTVAAQFPALDQAMAPAVSMAGPFGAWFQPATWFAFATTGSNLALRAADARTYVGFVQTYANPATYIQPAMALFGQVAPVANAAEVAAN